MEREERIQAARQCLANGGNNHAAVLEFCRYFDIAQMEKTQLVSGARRRGQSCARNCAVFSMPVLLSPAGR